MLLLPKPFSMSLSFLSPRHVYNSPLECLVLLPSIKLPAEDIEDTFISHMYICIYISKISENW